MTEHPVELRNVCVATYPVSSRGIEEAEYHLIESATGIEDSPEIVGSLRAVCLQRIFHQHLGMAHDGRRRRAQFLPHEGNERPLGSPIGTVGS
jgi:hypothetical protein